MGPLVNEPYHSLMPYVPGKPVSETEREQIEKLSSLTASASVQPNPAPAMTPK